MSKKYTAKQLNDIVYAILCNSFDHIEAAIAEIKKKNITDIEKASDSDRANIRMLNILITTINDVVHPAHKLAYQHFSNYHHMLDLLVKNHKVAIESKLIPPCFNTCCDPDGSRSYEKAVEYKKAESQKESENKQTVN